MEVFVTKAMFVDGKPNVPLTDESPPWVNEAFKMQYLGVVRLEDNTAVLAVKTIKGIIIAEAGDRISNDLMNGLVVTKRRDNTLTWDVVEKMLEERNSKNTDG